jgi:hypothetical protein
MNVTRLARQGLRAFVFFPQVDEEAAHEVVRTRILSSATGWESLGQISDGTLELVLADGPLKTKVRCGAAQRGTVHRVSLSGGTVLKSGPVDADNSSFGILLDADLFDDRRSEGRDPKPHLNRALGFLDGKLIPYVASLLEGLP